MQHHKGHLRVHFSFLLIQLQFTPLLFSFEQLQVGSIDLMLKFHQLYDWELIWMQRKHGQFTHAEIEGDEDNIGTL